MTDRTVSHNTFVLERNYPAPPERLFAAFADPAKKRRWYADGGINKEIEEYAMDFRVGGEERARYRFGAGSPFPGLILETAASYRDIVPGQRIIEAQTMSMGGRPISITLATFEILADEKGSKLVLTHQAAFFEGSDGPERRQHGWSVLLDKLSHELAQ
jgi:uncharacterized protein YndB with AHSA1/START domain